MTMMRDISNLNKIDDMIKILERKRREAVSIVNNDFDKILAKYVKAGKATKSGQVYTFKEGVTVVVAEGHANLSTTVWENGNPKYPQETIIKEDSGKLVCLTKSWSGKGTETDINKFGPDVKSFIIDCYKSR